MSDPKNSIPPDHLPHRFGPNPPISVTWFPDDNGLKPVHDAALAEAERLYLHGGEYAASNRHTGERIWISKTNLRKATSGHSGLQKIRLVPYLPQCLEQAVFLESATDRRGRPDILAFHYYRTQVEMDGRFYEVRLIVREVREGDGRKSKFYDHELREVSEAAGVQRAIDR